MLVLEAEIEAELQLLLLLLVAALLLVMLIEEQLLLPLLDTVEEEEEAWVALQALPRSLLRTATAMHED